MRWVIVVLLLLTASGVATFGVAATNKPEVHDVWIRLGSGDQPPATAYFEVINQGDDDRLVEVSSTLAQKVVLGRLKWKGLDAHFETVKEVAVPAESRTLFEPGGYAAVFVNLTEPLRIGEIVPLAFRFAHGGTLYLDGKVTNQELGNRGR